MNEVPKAAGTRAPWHLWVVGIISLLWNAMGAFDYLMSQTRNEQYMAAFTPEQLDEALEDQAINLSLSFGRGSVT